MSTVLGEHPFKSGEPRASQFGVDGFDVTHARSLGPDSRCDTSPLMRRPPAGRNHRHHAGGRLRFFTARPGFRACRAASVKASHRHTASTCATRSTRTAVSLVSRRYPRNMRRSRSGSYHPRHLRNIRRGRCGYRRRRRWFGVGECGPGTDQAGDGGCRSECCEEASDAIHG
jgi:hypothetical protein